eukprot:scaffold2193_cov179-Ochromonas_danica.AAC.40
MTSSTIIPPPIAMDREERIKRFGIECIGPAGDGILFKAGHWRPGGEYVQKLLIRNVSTEVKKLKYKLPSTRYFSLAYPEPIILSPGLFVEVDVVFRPVEHEPYDDTIYIKMLDGIPGHGFHISVRATIDKLSIVAPDGLDLGYCPTYQQSELRFDLINDGEIDAPYEWDVPEPFHFQPSSGVIPVGQKHVISITIMPTDASVFVAKAYCRVGAGVHAIIPNPVLVTKLSAIGKYPYITLSDSSLSFDEVVSGVMPEKKETVLVNNSVVPAEFELIRFDEDRDEVFDIEPKKGVIEPNSEIPVIIRYNALAMGCYTVDRYAYRTPSNCNTILTLKALTMPPKVVLFKDVQPSAKQLTSATAQAGSSKHNPIFSSSLTASSMSTLTQEEGSPIFSLNFRDVEVGRIETRTLFLSNDSEREVAFFIMGDEQGIFQMSPKQGVIPSYTKKFAVRIMFTPPKPINYYRRFFVLVADALPLFYDCLGTGFVRAKGEVKEQRPAPIRHAHVQAYRNRLVAGYGDLSPEELDALREDEDAPSSFFAQIGRQGTKALSITTLQRPVTRTGDTVRNLVAPAHEYFIEHTDSSAKEVTVNQARIDFGYTGHYDISTPQTIVIHNRTHGKVSVQWFVPFVKGMDLQSSLSSSISSERDIVTVDGAEKAIRALQAFAVQPISTEINPGQSANFFITFCPKQSNRNFVSELEAYVFFKNQRTFRLVNDFSLVPPWCLTVQTMGHTFSTGQLLAKGKFYGGNIRNGKLVFPCCYYGEAIYQTCMIRNTSNLPCTFSIDLGWHSNRVIEVGNNDKKKKENGSNNSNNDDNLIFKVKPCVGEIDAEGFVLICIRFQPKDLKKYHQLLRLTVNGEECNQLLLEGSCSLPYLTIPELMERNTEFPEDAWGLPATIPRIIPKGKIGQIYLKPTSLGLSTNRKLTLKNTSRLPCKFFLSLPSEADDILRVGPMQGVLRGNDVIDLSLCFAPKNVELYSFELKVSVYPIAGKPSRVLDSNQPGPVEPPDLLQEFRVTLLAQGEVGALTFDPAETEVDVRLVHTSEEKSIWLENISDAEISYKLYYKEEFLPDLVDEEATTLSTEIIPLVDFMSTHHSKRSSNSKAITFAKQSQKTTRQQDGNNSDSFEHSLFCEQNTGLIAARSRTRLVFTYRPVKSGMFHFAVYAQIEALDSTTKQSQTISNDEAALLRLAGNDLTLVNNFAPDLANIPLTATIKARAAFPKLLFEDIRTDMDMQISDIDYLWKRFSLSALNHDLSVPLTMDEISLYNASSPDLSRLKVYTFDFSPAILHSPIQTMTLQLRNHGYLETTYTMQLPNEKTLELENWCDEDEPSEELNRLISIIEELRLFSIEPKQATLQPGESCVLTLSYKHSSLKYGGIHNIPVLVKLSQGKQFYLDIRGRTLAPAIHPRRGSVRILDPKASSASLHSGLDGAGGVVGSVPPGTSSNTVARAQTSVSTVPDILLVIGAATSDGVITLQPVPMGLSFIYNNNLPLIVGSKLDHAPLQRIEVINVCAYNVQYEVFIGDSQQQQQAVDEIARNNYMLPVFHVANSSGLIQAGGSVYLDVYFYPLEDKVYTFPITIQYTPEASLIYSNTFTANSSLLNDSVSVGSRNAPTRRGTGGDRRRSRDRLLRDESPPRTSQQSAPQPVIKLLKCIVKARGYDPRYPCPIPAERLYEGGLPPPRPILTLSKHMVKALEDEVDFSILPTRSTVHRLLSLVNNSPTNIFEFAVDESSCKLCHEGLVSIQPLFGKILPQGTVIINIQIQAYCQPRIIEDLVKIMVREVVRSTQRSRGGAKQALIDKLKARKSVQTAHESVVSRPTFSRSMQLLLKEEGKGKEEGVFAEEDKGLHALLEEGDEEDEGNHGGLLSLASSKRSAGKYPSTISLKGDVIQPAASQHVLSNLQSQRQRGPHQQEETNVMTLNTSPNASQSQNNFLTAEDRSAAAGSRGGASRLDSPSRRGLTPNASLAPSSRGSGLASRAGGSMTGTSLGSGHSSAGGGGGGPRFGITYHLLVRLKGVVYTEDTIRLLPMRGEKGLARGEILNGHLLPTKRPFVPPTGMNYFDATYQTEQDRLANKARVNISMVENRDHELRAITSFVFDHLTRGLLGQEELRDQVYTTLTHRVMIEEIPIQERPSLSPFPLLPPPGQEKQSGQTGVFFREIESQPPLHLLLVKELELMSIPTEEDGTTLSLDHLKTVLLIWQLSNLPSIQSAIEEIDQQA